MNTVDNNQEAPVQPQQDTPAPSTDKFEISKSEYEELIKDRASFGSLKREFKDLKKSLEERETQQNQAPQPDSLAQKSFLRAAGIKDADEVQLALDIAKKLNLGVDAVVDDDYFTSKLDALRTKKANIAATADVDGGGGETGTKNTAAYWKAKGTPPTPADIPDRKTRQKIVREMRMSSDDSGKFYNEK